MLFDPGSFREAGALVQHRCSDFGMDRQQYYGALGCSQCYSLWPRAPGIAAAGNWSRAVGTRRARRRGPTPALPPPLAAGDGVVTGSGTVYGRPVFAFSQDFTGRRRCGWGGRDGLLAPAAAHASVVCAAFPRLGQCSLPRLLPSRSIWRVAVGVARSQDLPADGPSRGGAPPLLGRTGTWTTRCCALVGMWNLRAQPHVAAAPAPHPPAGPSRRRARRLWA